MVNNAGIFEGGDPVEISNDQWRKVLATDLDGVFYGAAPPCRTLRRRRVRSSTPHRFPGSAATGE